MHVPIHSFPKDNEPSHTLLATVLAAESTHHNPMLTWDLQQMHMQMIKAFKYCVSMATKTACTCARPRQTHLPILTFPRHPSLFGARFRVSQQGKSLWSDPSCYCSREFQTLGILSTTWRNWGEPRDEVFLMVLRRNISFLGRPGFVAIYLTENVSSEDGIGFFGLSAVLTLLTFRNNYSTHPMTKSNRLNHQ